MRLTSIKLSGFKSFAEPTNFLLPGQLVGVVGPNGCGKSNIMDAVRWVLGESRASELRGESMQDVIFNGTNTRKPASRSSVELVFDNADHRAGGQWSQFAEIAVKRVLTRDGTSSYYINNQPVRRRDVQDVFLGTGLGPRAYAIIGQGTISRIIESKPEELRLFLEEAAGVSKYKERRRETENRLSDTRENLTRVEDILRELNANLEKLEKQAEVAQRYQQLQQQVTRRQHQLWFLKRAEAETDQLALKAQADQAAVDLEARMADLPQGSAMVAVQWANNETGIIQPVAALAEIVHARGGRLHVDAVQGAGKVAFTRRDLGADTLALSAHKLGGPQGVGALVLGPGLIIEQRMLVGGGQERGARAGTENVVGIAGFGAAVREALASLPTEAARLAALRDACAARLKSLAPDAVIFGSGVERLPNTLCFAIPGLKAETALMAFDLNGVALSSGSACSSGKVKRSHVLAAMAVPDDLAAGALRLSLGWSSGEKDVIQFAAALEKTLRNTIKNGTRAA